MGRIIAAAALTACLTAGANAGEYELFTDGALGVALNVPPGYKAEATAPGEEFAVNAIRLSWPEGSYADLEVLVTRREAAYANVVTWAGFYQRRRGASGSFEAEGDISGEEELAAAGADEGLRSSYAAGGEERNRRLEVLFLASGNNIYVVEVSYPDVVESTLAAAAREILNTVKLLPPAEEEEAGVSGGRAVETESPSE